MKVINKEFCDWIEEISDKYKNTQIKAAIKVNNEMLNFYFELGRDLHNKSFKSSYGSKFYNKVSQELKVKLPNIKGFSPINLRYMEKFYNLYNEELQIVPQLVEQLFSIPWGHHRYIIDKCKNSKKALFFVKKTYENNWSREILLNFLDTNLFERDGKTINNFEKFISEKNKELAKQIIKDPYCFDFLSISEDFNEKELKDSLIENIQKFLLELGNGFAFVGKEFRFLVGDTELFLTYYFIILNYMLILL